MTRDKKWYRIGARELQTAFDGVREQRRQILLPRLEAAVTVGEIERVPSEGPSEMPSAEDMSKNEWAWMMLLTVGFAAELILVGAYTAPFWGAAAITYFLALLGPGGMVGGVATANGAGAIGAAATTSGGTRARLAWAKRWASDEMDRVTARLAARFDELAVDGDVAEVAGVWRAPVWRLMLGARRR